MSMDVHTTHTHLQYIYSEIHFILFVLLLFQWNLQLRVTDYKSSLFCDNNGHYSVQVTTTCINILYTPT